MLATKIKKLRKEKGMTQADLAKAVGVSCGTVAMWETGKRRPGYDMLNNLCRVFERNVGYILGFNENAIPISLAETQGETVEKQRDAEQYEDVIRKYVLLDEYGKAAVDILLRQEFNRCQEQGTICNNTSITVSISSKCIKCDNEDVP